jgi:hypothetical protein
MTRLGTEHHGDRAGAVDDGNPGHLSQLLRLCGERRDNEDKDGGSQGRKPC